MNILDTTITSPLDQAKNLKDQNKEQVVTFINGLISSIEKTDYSRFLGDELVKINEKNKHHINYWKAVMAELLRDEPKKVEPVAQPTLPKTDFSRQGLPKIKPK